MNVNTKRILGSIGFSLLAIVVVLLMFSSALAAVIGLLWLTHYFPVAMLSLAVTTFVVMWATDLYNDPTFFKSAPRVKLEEDVYIIHKPASVPA